jgi:cell shape-determining protein MreD
MLRFIKNGCSFLLLCLFQIYFEGGFFIRPVADFLLIFLIFSFFDFPFFYLALLLLARGLVFDTLSGLTWGINLFSLFFSFGIGFLLTLFLERNNFLSKIIIGESIINLYFLIIFISNLLISHSNLWFIILIDALINSMIYLALIMLVRKKKIYDLQKKFS